MMDAMRAVSYAAPDRSFWLRRNRYAVAMARAAGCAQ